MLTIAIICFFQKISAQRSRRPIHRRARHTKSLSPAARPNRQLGPILDFYDGDSLLKAATRQLSSLANESRNGHQILAASSKLILLQLLPGQPEDGEGELLALLADLWEALHGLDSDAGLLFLQRYERGTGRGAGDYQSVPQVFASILWQILPLAPANRLTRAKYIYSLLPKNGAEESRAELLKSTGAMRIDYAALDLPNSYIDEDNDDSNWDKLNRQSKNSWNSRDSRIDTSDFIPTDEPKIEPDTPVPNFQPSSAVAIVGRIFRKIGHAAAFLAFLPSHPPGVPQMQFLLSEVCWRNGVSTDNCGTSVAAIAHFSSQPMMDAEELIHLEAVIDEYLKAVEEVENCSTSVQKYSQAMKSIFVSRDQKPEGELFSVSEGKRLDNPQCPIQAIEVFRYGPYRPALGRTYLYRK